MLSAGSILQAQEKKGQTRERLRGIVLPVTRKAHRASLARQPWAAVATLLFLLRHLARDFLHEFGPQIGQNAFDDAGYVIVHVTWRVRRIAVGRSD